jgi:hypothetical protein
MQKENLSSIQVIFWSIVSRFTQHILFSSFLCIYKEQDLKGVTYEDDISPPLKS